MKRPSSGQLPLIILLFLFQAGCSSNPEPISRMPDFRLNDLDHGRFYLNEQHEKTVMLVFWATYCVECKKQLADMTALHRQYSGTEDDGTAELIIAAVCIDPEQRDKVKDVQEALSLPYPILLDPGGRVLKQSGLQAVPSTLLLGQSAEIILSRNGYNRQVYRQLESHVQRLLAP